MITEKEFKEEVIKWAEKIGVEPKEIHIREMKNKWGSCSSKGRLTFAKDLLNETSGKRAEVIVHELLHLRYPTHNRLFKALQKAYLNHQ
ncbi:MAG: M48 family metallopeptidase [Thermosipho sp. (in: Bacteria)]|nr:M48 family metallopeptidase [Thermosipho sp. (in: thermotogales)]